MDEEDEYSPSEVSIILNIWSFWFRNWNGANTNKKKVTDVITLIRYIEANDMKNEKIESLPAP